MVAECIRCHEERKIYARGWCHRCYRAEYRKTHLEEERAYNRANYHRHAEQYKANNRAWREANPEKVRAWYEANAEMERERKKKWLVAHPGYYESWRQTNPTYNSVYYHANKEREIERHRIWRLNNLEYVRERHRVWFQVHPEARQVLQQRRRARKMGLPKTLTREQWIAIKSAYKQCCAYCGKKPKFLTQDHVVPISKGGGTVADNIVPACKSCNSKKRDKIILDAPPLRLLL